MLLANSRCYSNYQIADVPVSRLSTAVIIILLVLGQGCMMKSIETQAISIGMSPATIKGETFEHRIYSREVTPPTASNVKIFLIDGDGQAFLNRTTIAADPTSKYSTLLSMSGDFSTLGAVYYLGRPCYHSTVDPACNPLYWTVARYSFEIVDSLATVIEQLLEKNERALLVGYSGGGVLAMLIAARLPAQLLGVVTYGAPLDSTAWTEFHGYSRLAGSIDTANNPQSYSGICQRHLFGLQDKVVPVELISSWRWPMENASTDIASDHLCCWQESLLAAVRKTVSDCS